MALLTNAERETHFNMTGDNHKAWHIFTDDPYWIRRMEKVGATFVRTVGEGKEYTLPANQVTVRKPYSPSQKQLDHLKHLQGRETAIRSGVQKAK